MRASRALVAIVALVLIVLVACGGDGDDQPDPTLTPPPVVTSLPEPQVDAVNPATLVLLRDDNL
ncbi:MAG: hypothetical protein J4N95_07895 [Chloroflexi bacterium]|nr:hypothetical protein [Chloroflexota bacterium]MCI0856298.1 hypothetical protein [Chloroflexota bacterium]MCI0889808.1 hypothetical protein [Chloroflexota bacterium]